MRPRHRSPGDLAGTLASLVKVGGVALGVLLLAAPLTALEPRSVAVSAGVFDIGRDRAQAEIGLELRVPTRLWGLAATGGVTVTEESAVYLFAGLRRDLPLAERWRLTPGFAVALYEEGDGKDLGGPVEFRSSIELGWVSRRSARVALGFYHLSNAGIYELNPGANSLILTFSVPLPARLRPAPRFSTAGRRSSTWR